jgi:hypothetical protein
MLTGQVDQEPVEGDHRHPVEVRGGLHEHGQPLVHGEERLLVVPHRHRHDELIEELSRALHEVEMPHGHRIERAREDRATHPFPPPGWG